MFRILVADDEIKIRQTIYDYMSAKGMTVSLAQNGEEAIEKATEESFDLIILDVMMPVIDGIEACRAIRRYTDVPVLFLSALGEEEDLLKGYKSGADDYIVKPFPLSVLYEKCLKTMKRYKGLDKENRLSFGGITLDLQRIKVFADNEEISLSGKDFRLLEYLMQNKGIVLSRENILLRVWGYDFDGDDRVVDTHIKRLRKALGKHSECVKTVINMGYVFKED